MGHGRGAAPWPLSESPRRDALPIIRGFVDERLTYGYRLITALVNRKRVHRIMQRHALLLERPTGQREGRVYDGTVMVMQLEAALVL